MARSPVDATSSDEELACRAQRGCVSSFDRLLRRFQSPLLQFLRHSGAGSDAEDLLQETFLRAYENLHRYSSKWSFAAWLYTIARRLSINHHRISRPRTDDDSAQAAPAPTPEPWRTAAQREERARLWELAGRALSEEQTTALWLHYVEDMPIQEIAVVLRRSRSSVKVLLFRARKRLLPLLEALDGKTETQPHPWPQRSRWPVLETPYV